ncbi:MAG: TolC family protein [Tannerella sp.]|jgi:outer membrane protein TolC|nr:TolC family protein [Tannerella sp.]
MLTGKKVRWVTGAVLCFGVAFFVEAEGSAGVGNDTLQTGLTDGAYSGEVTVNLEQAVAIALSDNPTVVVAGMEIELKKSAGEEVYAGLFPEVSLSGAYSRTLKKQTMVMDFGGQSQTIQVGTDNSYSGGLTVSLPVFAPALYKSINLTKTDVELALEKARSSKLGMINQVTKAYYQLLLSQDGYEVLQKSYRQAEANFNVVNEMFKQGLVSEYDKIRADVQVRSLEPNVVSARNGVNLAKLQLKVLMGIDKEIQLDIVGNLRDYEMQLFENELNKKDFSLEENTDLRQLDLNVTMLKQSLELQKTNFMPTLGASFNYMYTSLNNDFKIADYKWFPYSTIGLSLTIPLFKAGNIPKVRQAGIRIRQLAETRLNTERMLSMQVQSYLNNMTASAEQVLSNKESIMQAEKGRLIAQKRYEVGKGTILELNDSEVALTQTQLTYNQSIFDYLTAKADLDQVLGSSSVSY